MSAPKKTGTFDHDKIALQQMLDTNVSIQKGLTQSDVDVPVRMGECGKRARESVTYSAIKKRPKPPGHSDIQARAKVFGQNMASRFAGMSDSDRTEEMSVVQSVADQMTEIAQAKGILTKNGAKKGGELKPNFTGDDFRGVQKDLDEATQSKTTAAFHHGFTQELSKQSPEIQKQGREFQSQMAKAQSAMRLPTKGVVATGKHEGEVRGQRHPTGREFPAFPGGSSAHSDADRSRAFKWVSIGDQVAQGTQGVAVPVVASMVGAGSETVSYMAQLLTASNVDSSLYTDVFATQQTKDRGSLKTQVNIGAKTIGMDIVSGEQPMTAPIDTWSYPTSPKRSNSFVTTTIGPPTAPTPGSPMLAIMGAHIGSAPAVAPGLPLGAHQAQSSTMASMQPGAVLSGLSQESIQPVQPLPHQEPAKSPVTGIPALDINSGIMPAPLANSQTGGLPIDAMVVAD